MTEIDKEVKYYLEKDINNDISKLSSEKSMLERAKIIKVLDNKIQAYVDIFSTYSELRPLEDAVEEIGVGSVYDGIVRFVIEHTKEHDAIRPSDIVDAFKNKLDIKPDSLKVYVSHAIKYCVKKEWIKKVKGQYKYIPADNFCEVMEANV